MKHLLLITLLLIGLLGALNAQVPPPQQGPVGDRDGSDDDNYDPCDRDSCRTCSQNQLICLQCKKGYIFSTKRGFCISREEFEDRGDAVSMIVGILNIVFILLVTGVWIYKSRLNNARYKNIAEQDIEMLRPELQENNNPFNAPQQIIRIGAPSEKTSQFDTQSMRSSQVKPDPMFLSNNNEADYKLQPNQPKLLENNTNNGNNNHNYNINNNNELIQSSPPSPGTATGKATNEGLTTNNLNGYWMTQAGKFSFQCFSNLHRIKHVMINFIILEAVISSMIFMSQSRGDDQDTDKGKMLLFVGFAVCMLIYWGFTLIPAIVIKIISCFSCFKNDPNGRCSNISIWILFLVPSVIMTVSTTSKVIRMDGFESQVWILLVLAGLLIIVFADKKSIELSKRWKGGRFSRLIKFRKIDFESTPIAQTQP